MLNGAQHRAALTQYRQSRDIRALSFALADMGGVSSVLRRRIYLRAVQRYVGNMCADIPRTKSQFLFGTRPGAECLYGVGVLPILVSCF